MNWMWIVILIPVVIWILSTVIRPPDEQPRRRFPPRGDGADPRRGRPPGEVERFLEEINRLRRRTGEEQSAPETPAARPEIPKPVKQAPRRVVRPTSRPRPQPAQPLEAQPNARRSVPSVPPPPPVPASSLQPASFAAPSSEVLDVIPAVPAPVFGSLSTATSPSDTIKGMFRNRETLAAAIVLHEVLGPPKCRRRHS